MLGTEEVHGSRVRVGQSGVALYLLLAILYTATQLTLYFAAMSLEDAPSRFNLRISSTFSSVSPARARIVLPAELGSVAHRIVSVVLSRAQSEVIGVAAVPASTDMTGLLLPAEDSCHAIPAPRDAPGVWIARPLRSSDSNPFGEALRSISGGPAQTLFHRFAILQGDFRRPSPYPL